MTKNGAASVNLLLLTFYVNKMDNEYLNRVLFKIKG